MKTGSYGWVMVALGALMTCVAIGAMSSLAAALRPERHRDLVLVQYTFVN